jgi:hypothetical protein
MFAIMATIFYFLYIELVFKREMFGSIEEELFSSPFPKIFRLFFILCWIIAGLFISIPILRIRMNNPDLFNLGFIWATFTVGFDMIITIIVNLNLPIEKRIPKDCI